MTTDTQTQSTIEGWFGGRLPDGWFTEPPEITADRDEILVVGRLTDPQVPEGSSTAAGREARISRFREDTRRQRMAIADEAERRFARKVAWGAVCGDARATFTTLSVPVMTRLRLPERAVLDTLIEAGVARSRSEALAWCVRLVAKHQQDWIAELREALVSVEQVRGRGPTI